MARSSVFSVLLRPDCCSSAISLRWYWFVNLVDGVGHALATQVAPLECVARLIHGLVLADLVQHSD